MWRVTESAYSSFPSAVGHGAAASTSSTLADLLRSNSSSSHNQFITDVETLLLPLPRRRISFLLLFPNLICSVKIPPKDAFAAVLNPKHRKTLSPKTILNDISGEERDGEIMAVMGASGSGKSTLIDALANRMAKGSLKGSITLNHEPLESKLQKAISAYVMQDDLLFPTLTVKETLTFAAEFRLPRSCSKSMKKTRVQALIDQLGLQNAANTLMGDEEHRGVSGGERRRVSIGIDIIHDPILLFLDEPTSGLDSTSALIVVKVLRRIAMIGSIIIMSIHQPSHRILKLLDRMIFLSHGNVVYSGTPSNLSLFFSKFAHSVPDGQNNWADYAMDLIRELEDTPEGTKSLVEFNKSWQALNKGVETDHSEPIPLKEAIAVSISKGKLFSDATVPKSAPSTVPKFANPPWIELALLLKRSFINFYRTPKMVSFRVATITITGIILATVFLKLDDSLKGVQERLGFFAFATSATFYTCADALPIFLQERYIFMRETAYNAYTRSSYVLSLALVFLPVLLILSLVFAVVTFWAVGLDGSFQFYFLIIFASYWAGNSFVTFVSGIVPQAILGYIIVVALLGYSLLFSGFFINRERIPKYWIWFHYISLIKYPYEAVLKNEFHGSTKCFAHGFELFNGTPLEMVPHVPKIDVLENISRVLGVNVTAETCMTTGEDILRQLGVSSLSKWQCLWVTVAWGFLFRILFYLCLLIGSKNMRR